MLPTTGIEVTTQLRQLRLRAFGHLARHHGIAHSAMVYIPEVQLIRQNDMKHSYVCNNVMVFELCMPMPYLKQEWPYHCNIFQRTQDCANAMIINTLNVSEVQVIRQNDMKHNYVCNNVMGFEFHIK